MDIVAVLKEAVQRKASDVFITVGVPPTLKIDGALVCSAAEPERMTPADTQAVAERLMTKLRDIRTFQDTGECDFAISMPEIGRFRINAFNQRGSCAISIRRIYLELPDPDALRIPATVLDLARLNRGLVLVTGPTGCGKTTTLAAIIDKINRERACHVLTLEDPIEYLHRHRMSIINQREIGTDTLSYAAGLRAAMRESPDVILIGEMRDLETISIALTAAETGHLVLSTLHTVGAAKTIDRVVDIFPPNQQQQIKIQLSTVLQAVVSQQLVPSAPFGLVPAFEIMKVNGAIRNMIREGKTPQIDGVMQMAGDQGMSTMDNSLVALFRDGAIDRDDAIHYAGNPDGIQRFLN
ncbi:MAG: type IV pilus twitching motility protein PilT [Clostridia bacterium]|nr:type IV pilus twitching motility protein PilT [Clostridia bacterium]